MIRLDPERIAAAAGGSIVAAGGAGSHPVRAEIDSRRIQGGELFFGLAGERTDGGRFARDAIAAGAWGLVLAPAAADELLEAGTEKAGGKPWVIAAEDPLAGLQGLAREWRREIGCSLVGVTGSTGKTSVKDISRALLLARVHASPENYNTEIGLPLALLDAPADTEILVMEMAMRGAGQIAELCRIAEPDIAVITNVGPVHLELLGSIEAIAAAKAEILSGLRPGGRAVLPAGDEALRPHLIDGLEQLSFGPGGDVHATDREVGAGGTMAMIAGPGAAEPVAFEFPFDEAHNLTNALCAVAIGIALGYGLGQMASRTSRIGFSRLRGEKVTLGDGILLLNDCYNANPISMRAAIEDLAGRDAGRRIAILGEMAELGPDGPRFHAEIGELARELGVAKLVGVGEGARDYSPDLWAPDPSAAAELLATELRSGDVALVKASRSAGLERLTEALRSRLGERPAA